MPNSHAHVVDVFFIHLDGSLDICRTRKRNMLDQIEKLSDTNKGVRCVVVDAYSPWNTIYSKSPRLSEPENGCFHSHVKAMSIALRNSSSETANGFFCVAEDDIVVSDMLVIADIVKMAPSDWEILQVHINSPEVITGLYKQIYISSGKKTLFAPWQKYWSSTGFYIIKNDAARVFVKNFEQYINEHERTPTIDDVLFSRFKTYSLTYPFISTTDSDSFIHPEHLGIHTQCTDIIKKINSSDPFSPRISRVVVD